MIRQLRNKLFILKLLITTLFFCLNAGPYIVLENYGNWKTLSAASKTAYVTGLWDSYMSFFGDEPLEKYNNKCGMDGVIRVFDLVEVLDSLYEQEINRSFSPAFLLKEKGLRYFCGN